MRAIPSHGTNQGRVAGLHPPPLAAIIPWEGQNDRYRDSGYHGGILSEFQKLWAKHQVVNIQYGLGARAKKNPNTGEPVAGPVSRPDWGPAKKPVRPFQRFQTPPLYEQVPRALFPALSCVTLPLLTSSTR